MARYTKVLKSLAHNAVGDRRIQAAAPAGNNYYVTGATLGGSPNYTLTLARNGGLSDVTVNLSALSDAANPGGSNTQLQYNNGGAFGGMDDWTWDGTDLNVAGSSKLKFGASLRHIVQSGDNLLIRNSENNGNINLNAKNDMKFFIDGVQKMHIDSNGNVGVGTTSVDTLLQVEGNAAGSFIKVEGTETDNSAGIYTGLHIKRYFPRIRLEDTSNNSNMYIWALGSQMRFGSSAGSSSTSAMFVQSGSANNTVTNTASVQINNMLKIGATDPLNSGRLSIIDTTRPLVLGYDTSNYVNFEVGSSGQLTIDAGNDINLDANSGLFNFKDGGTEFFRIGEDGSSNTFLQTKVDAKDIIFKQYDGTEVMRITDTARVGIGNNNPGFELTLGDRFMWDGNHFRANKTNGASMRNEDPSSTNPVFTFNNDVDTGMSRAAANELSLITAGTEAIRVDSSQNVGIGTTSPQQPLHVLTSANDKGILIDVSDDTHEGRLLFGDTSSNAIGHIGYNHSLNAMRFFTNGSEALRLESDQDANFYGNITTDSLGLGLRFDGRDDLLIRGTASFDMEITAPQDVAFGIDSDNNETTHAFLWKKDTKTPSSAGTELMKLNEDKQLFLDQYLRMQRNTSTNGLNLTDSGGNVVPVHAKGGFFGDGFSLNPDSSEVILYKSTTGSTSATAGKVKFASRNDAGTAMPYAEIEGIAYDDTASAEHGHIVFRTEKASTMTEQMRITNSRVGIGTSDPSELFNVESASNTLALFKSTDNRGLIQVADDDTTASIVAENSTLSLGLTSQISTSNINIDTSGHLGIGTTSPNYALDVYKDTSSFVARFKNTSSNGYVMRLDAGGDNSNLQFQTDHIIASRPLHLMNDNADLYVRTSGYKFGVGTSNPKTSMSLVGALSIEERADHETTNAGWGQLWVKNDSPNKLYFTDDAGTDHDLTAGGGGTIGGSLSDNYIPIGTAADTIGDFVLGYSAGSAIIIGSDPSATISDNTHQTVLGSGALANVTSGGRNTAIGSMALNALTDGLYNTAIGAEVLKNLTGADYNTYIGYNAGITRQGGSNNTAVGMEAGMRPTGNRNVMLGYKTLSGAAGSSAGSNVAIGAESMLNATSATENVIVGDQAGYSISTGGYNVAIGSDSLRAATTANYNIAIGKNAMQAGTLTSDHNIGIGYNAAKSAQGAATENIALGSYAGQDLTTGVRNTFVGTYAGTGNTTGQDNVAIGHSALQENQDGDDMVAIGRYAAYNTNPAGGTGDSVVIGSSAGFTNTTGVQNTFVGHRAGYNNTTSNQQVFIGREAGYNHTEGTTNVFVGARSGYLNTTGSNNVAVGHQALYNNVHGDRNTAIGYQALHSSTPSDGGGQNTAVGDRAGYSTTTGHTNVYMGYLAGYSLTDGERNVIIGHEAGRFSSTLDHSVLIGNGAGYNVSGAVESVIMGRNAGYFASGNFNTFIGTQAGRGDTSLTHATVSSVAVGHNAMYYHSTANYSVAVGASALQGASAGLTGDYNVAVGRQALMDTTSGYGNVAMGYLAGKSITTGRDSVFIGLQAGQYTSTGVENTMVGYLAGRNTVGGSYNTFMGWSAGFDNVGNRNTFLGYAAGTEFKQSGDGTNTAVGMYSMHRIETGSANVAMGYEALKGVVGSDNDRNVAIGAQALYSSDGGDNNIAIGYQAGYSVTTGTGNIFIGDNAGNNADHDTESDKLVIANSNTTSPLIAGDFSSQFLKINGGIIQNQTEALYLYDAVGGVYANPAIVTPLGNFALIKPEVGPGVGAIPVQLPEGTAARVGFETTIVNNVAADPASTLSVTVAQGTSDVIYEGSSNSASSTVSIGTHRGANKTFLLVDTGVWIVKA